MTSQLSRSGLLRHGLLVLAPAMVMSGAWADEPTTDKAPANDSSARVGQGLGAVLGPKSTEGSGTTVDVGKGLRDVLRSGENRGESTTTSIGTGWGSVFGAGGSLSNTTPLAGKNLDDLLRPATIEGAAVSGIGLRVALILEQLRRGEKIDLDKTLSEEELGYALAHNRELLKAKTPSVQAETASLEAVRDQLAVLWLSRYKTSLMDVQKNPQLIQSLPLLSRMLLGDYLSKQGDTRCIPFYQASYLEWEQQNTDPVTGAIRKVNNSVAGVHALAWFYQGKKQWRETAEAYLLSEKYSTAPVWISSALVEAGRAYHFAGDEAKSQQTYAKIPQYGQGWYCGMAIYDQAESLIATGKFQKARELITSGLAQAEQGAEVGEARPAIVALVGYSYLREGNLEKARLEAERTLKEIEASGTHVADKAMQPTAVAFSVSSPLSQSQAQFEETHKAALVMARQTLKYATLWSQSNLSQPKLEIEATEAALRKATQWLPAPTPALPNPVVWRGWLDVRSQHRVALAATIEGLSKEAIIRTSAAAPEQAADHRYYFSNRLKIEVILPSTQAGASLPNGEIVVSSPQLKPDGLRLPLRLLAEAK